MSESSGSGLSWTLLTAASLLSKLAEDSVSDSLRSPSAPSLSTRSSAASPLSKLSAGLGLDSPNSSLVSAGFPTLVDFVPVTSAVSPSP